MFKRFSGFAALVSLVLSAVVSTVYAADQPTPAFAQPEVLKAGLQIGLSEEQQPKFKEGVTNFFNCRISAFNKLMKGRDQVDMERKMKSKTKGCVRAMDKEMGSFITEEQQPKYENYRETLLAHMKGQ